MGDTDNFKTVLLMIASAKLNDDKISSPSPM